MTGERKGIVRLARVEDAPQLLEIYAPYVTDTVVSFEYQVPTLQEFTCRVETTLAMHPYLVWEEEGTLLGYAYAHPYAVRPAYQWGAELTVYLRPEACHRGIGTRLYGVLFDLLRLQGVRTVYGCITAENQASVSMHTALGFREGGLFRKAGYKQGRWLDVLWLEREIAQYDTPRPLIPFAAIGERDVQIPGEFETSVVFTCI